MRLLALGLTAVVVLPGCGALFHANQTLTVRTEPEARASIYENGRQLKNEPTTPGVYSLRIFTNHVGDLVAIDDQENVVSVPVERVASGWAIVGDALWCITIIGVAAPISDAALGTFVKIKPNISVSFPAAPAEQQNPAIVYAVGGVEIAAADMPPALDDSLPDIGEAPLDEALPPPPP